MSPPQNRSGAFREILKGRVVVAGVGNTLRGDDGLGPLLARRLRSRVEVPCIDAGEALENHLGAILRERPDTVLLIDAVHLGLEAGDHRLLAAGQIAETGLSTHDASPGFILELLRVESGADIYLLGVQPATLELGAGISWPVRRALRLLEEDLTEALSRRRTAPGPRKDGVLTWT